jgi:hypothetical protein
MWKVSPKTPHTQFLCRVQFYKLPLETHRGQRSYKVNLIWPTPTMESTYNIHLESVVIKLFRSRHTEESENFLATHSNMSKW